MAGTNGRPVIIPEQAEREPYRPTAGTAKVYDTIVSGLSEVVHTSAHQAMNFVSLYTTYDRDKHIADRYQHLVDATECLEIALTHLGQLRSAVSQRRLLEDDQNEPMPF